MPMHYSICVAGLGTQGLAAHNRLWPTVSDNHTSGDLTANMGMMHAGFLKGMWAQGPQ